MKGYNGIIADDFCCIGAVLEAILIRNNYIKYSQYDIAVFNLKGQRIRTLIDANQALGGGEFYWDGTDDNGRELSSGAYFIKMAVDNEARGNAKVIKK